MGMLVLRREDGHWVEIVHVASGDVLRVRTCNFRRDGIDLVFDDDARHFGIRREESPRRVPRDA